MGIPFSLNEIPRVPERNLQKKVPDPVTHVELYPDRFGGACRMLLEENLPVEVETTSRLLNAHEIAEALSVGLSTVYLLLERGELTCIRIGRSVRVRPEDLEEFIESRVQGKSSYE
jgi:excisionase family DNA binding protein